MKWLHEIFLAASLAAMIVGWEAARRRLRPQKQNHRVVNGRVVMLGTAVALALALGGLLIQGLTRGAFPLETLADALQWFSTTPLVAVLAIYAITRNVWPAFVLLPLAAGCQVASLFFNDWFADEAARRALGNTLLGLHVGFFLIGYGAIIVAGGLAIIYLILDRRLKRFAPQAVWSEEQQVSLGRLDHLLALSVGLGVVLWGLGLGLALALFSRQMASLNYAARAIFFGDVTVITSFLVWGYFLAFTVLRRRMGWIGRRACLFVLGGVALLLLSYAAGKLQHDAALHGFSATRVMMMERAR